jgi:tetratricopeptide (TPR) repeat protein
MKKSVHISRGISIKSARSPEERRLQEEALRPSRFLGYDHYSLAQHLYSIGSFPVARKEAERAVWLNPYKVKFLLLLSWCFFREGLISEAEGKARECLDRKPGEESAFLLLRLIDEARRKQTTGGSHV